MDYGSLLAGLLAFATGCAGLSVPDASPRGPAQAAITRTARCAIERGWLQCGATRRPLADLGLALPLRGSAPRVLGGLWLLDAQHTLARVDARGRLTGRAAEAGATLLVSSEFVCTLADSARLRCRIDHHDEAGCDPHSALTAPIEVDPGFTPTQLLPGALLCGASAEGAPRCAQLSRPCARGCLRFPGCGVALRCIQACPPHRAAIVARGVEAPRAFRSSFAPAAVTHAHGREQGGYAGARARP